MTFKLAEKLIFKKKSKSNKSSFFIVFSISTHFVTISSKYPNPNNQQSFFVKHYQTTYLNI